MHTTMGSEGAAHIGVAGLQTPWGNNQSESAGSVVSFGELDPLHTAVPELLPFPLADSPIEMVTMPTMSMWPGFVVRKSLSN